MRQLREEILELIAGNTFYENCSTGAVVSNNWAEAGAAGVPYVPSAGNQSQYSSWPDWPDGDPC